ncbi:MAG: EFR1 family ferrodoxin [Clostridiales Family XIII bacterium]|jgi:ferredoxin|nr:EFR1 family ferrodoxin [Clostridiales Family XIII bacterium]
MSRVHLAYFSGSGSTAYFAGALADAFRAQGCKVAEERIGAGPAAFGRGAPGGGEGLLVLVFCVHEFNAPHPVRRWIDSLPESRGTAAAVISVSGGGEVSPNRASRRASIAQLEQRGYEVFFEDMAVMPCNFFVEHPDPLPAMLLEAAPATARRFAACMAAREHRRTRPPLLDRVASRLCTGVSGRWSPKFGRSLKATDACTRCGRCASACPMGNITVTDGGPRVGDGCACCLGCVYACPAGALRSASFQTFVLKSGYDIGAYLSRPIPEGAWQRIDKLARGFLWKGVRRYLEQRF